MVCTLRDSSCQLFGKRNKRQKKQFSIGSPKALDFSSEKGPGLRCAPFAKNIFIRMLSNDSGAASNHPRVMPAPSRTSCFLNFIFWYPAIRRHETPPPSLTPPLPPPQTPNCICASRQQLSRKALRRQPQQASHVALHLPARYSRGGALHPYELALVLSGIVRFPRMRSPEHATRSQFEAFLR